MNDGGPAFPVPEFRERGDKRVVATSGEFQNPLGYYDGMSLRDWFAGMALAGLIESADIGTKLTNISMDAYSIADAMLKVRETNQ